MNYSLSPKILEKIKNSKNILINCHRSPDPDSLGSALAMYLALKQIGKEATLISPDNVPADSAFLPFSEKIQKKNFEKFNFAAYDLFLVLDSANGKMVTGAREGKLPQIFTIVIDHHKTNEKFGDINLLDIKASSCAEVIYKIFLDWEITLDKDLATVLLTGILGDTGVFKYPGTGVETLAIATELIKKGADKDKIVLNIFRSIDFIKVKFWGEIIARLEMDAENKFVWSAVPYDVYQKFGKPGSAKETAASMFAQLVNDTDFGIIMVEEEKNLLAISLRARTDFDVSPIAVDLGGGGHAAAAAAKIYNLDFDKAVLKVLETARKYAKKFHQRN